ncbi:MAG: GntR family transcriptional regulator [Clostridia bacterium]
MERRKNLYQFVYTDLKKQILSERWDYGSRLPSVDRLAVHYYAGKWTIQKALELLEKDGLIRTEERRRAVVLYQSPYEGEHIPVHQILRKCSGDSQRISNDGAAHAGYSGPVLPVGLGL